MIINIQKGVGIMSKKIITIGRQFGSGGHEIGERLAKKLNIPLYDRNLVEKAVEKLNLNQEDVESVDESIFRNLAMSVQRLFGNDNTPYTLAESGSLSDQLYKAQCRIIKELADQGPCVIVGRCADHVLRNRDDVLSVFICADVNDRIKRMMRVREMNEERAAHTVKTTDKNRRTYYEYYTEKKWGAPENYDIVLNVSRLGLDKVVEIIAGLYEG